MLHALSTIAEIDAEIEAGTATVADARKILVPRSKRTDSKSGARAKVWLAAHKKLTLKVEPKPRTQPAPIKSANFRTQYAEAKVARAGIAKGQPGWRKAFFEAYTSAGAHTFEAIKTGQLASA